MGGPAAEAAGSTAAVGKGCVGRERWGGVRWGASQGGSPHFRCVTESVEEGRYGHDKGKHMRFKWQNSEASRVETVLAMAQVAATALHPGARRVSGRSKIYNLGQPESVRT